MIGFKLFVENQVFGEKMYWTTRSPLPAEVGSRVRVDDKMKDPAWRFLEEAFEAVRVRKAPDAPSRVSPDVCYVCRTPEVARKWGSVIYEVKVTGKIFDANAEYWTEAAAELGRASKRPSWAENEKVREMVEDWAEDYWRGFPPERHGTHSIPEVIVNGVVIVSRVV